MNTVNPFSDFEWHRSSFCASGACVQVALGDDGSVLVRDSKRGDDSPVLSFTSGAWARVLEDINDGYLPDYAAWLANGGLGWGLLQFTAAEWDVFEAGVKAGEFDFDKLSSGDEAGSGFRGVARSGHAATGAGAIAVPPVPVAANRPLATVRCPECGGGVTAVVEALAVGEAWPKHYRRDVAQGCSHWGMFHLIRPEHIEAPVPVAAQPRYVLDVAGVLDLISQYAEACVEAATTGSPKARDNALERREEVRHAIRVALTPVPNVEPEPAWGSGPLVKHVTETPAEPQMPYLTGQPVSFVDDGDGQAVQR